LKGKIKKYLSFRGFGFIEIEGSEDDIFFHISNYPKTVLPSKEQDVEFTIIDTPKGKEASEIKLIEKTAEKVETEEEKEEPEVMEKEAETTDDLNKLNGVGPKYQELLRSAGINSTQELAKESPEELFDKLISVNEKNEITKRPPTLENVKAWINLAKE
jgi:predicted flap endonuclease-1-like 5' DNA nuclease